MPLLLSNYAAALKEIVLPYIKDNYPKEKILVDKMKRNAGVTRINDEFIAPLRTSRHGGVANLADDGNNVISSSGATTSRATVSVEILSASFDISRLAIDASKGPQMAVESALTFQAQTLAEDFGRHVNRQMYHDGIGIVSQVRTTGGSVGAGTAALELPDANLDDGRSLDWYGTINNDISPLKYITVDNVLGIGTGAADLGTVTSVTGTSVVMTGGPAIVASDSVYLQDGSGEGAGTSDLLGVRAALSSTTGTSTYAGVARNVTGWAPAFGSASEALTLQRMSSAYLSAREYAMGGDGYVILVNKSLYQKYGEILTAMRRTVNESDLLGGYTGLEFAAGAGRVGVFLDYDVPDGEVLILNLDSWTLCQVSDVDWLEDPQGGSLMRLQNTITYQATMVWFANMLCLAPASNARETRKTD